MGCSKRRAAAPPVRGVALQEVAGTHLRLLPSPLLVLPLLVLLLPLLLLVTLQPYRVTEGGTGCEHVGIRGAATQGDRRRGRL